MTLFLFGPASKLRGFLQEWGGCAYGLFIFAIWSYSIDSPLRMAVSAILTVTGVVSLLCMCFVGAWFRACLQAPVGVFLMVRIMFPRETLYSVPWMSLVAFLAPLVIVILHVKGGRLVAMKELVPTVLAGLALLATRK